MNEIAIDLTGRTILIVDDNPANLGVLADYLEALNFDIFTATDGKDALQIIQMIHPDLILQDVMMPGIDGFEVCRRLKADAVTKDIPVIFMTALDSPADKVKGFAVGAVDYVTKPFNQEEVLARIKTHLTVRLQTLQLQTLNAALTKRAAQLEMSSQVAQRITSILDLDTLLAAVVRLVQERFAYYCVGIWLLDEAQPDRMVLRAFAGQTDVAQFSAGFAVAVDARPSIIAHALRSQDVYLANDLQHDIHYFFWEALPNARSELALPLGFGEAQSSDDVYFGVLDIQDDEVNAFAVEDVPVMQMLANQIAVAIHNAQVYARIK